MRIYVIGMTEYHVPRGPAATVNRATLLLPQGELHAARSGKRLMALWNALPGVEKQTKVGVTAEPLIDQCGRAIEALPDPEQKKPSDNKAPVPKQGGGDRDAATTRGRRPFEKVASVMGWTSGTRSGGLFSGTLKKTLGLTLHSADGGARPGPL